MAVQEFSTNDLWRAMHRASEDIKREVSALLERSSREFENDLLRYYPVGPTGNLRNRVFRYKDSLYNWKVRAFAPHVHIYEEGTKPRHDPTRGNAYRGRSPKRGPIFKRYAADRRARMLEDCRRVLEREHT